MKTRALFAIISLTCLLALGVSPIAPPDQDAIRQKAHTLMSDGNRKEAAELFETILKDPSSSGKQAASDLRNLVNCLNQLGRQKEVDAKREKAISVHGDHWQLLFEAAKSYFNGQHYGYVIAGAFERGHHRGGNARYVPVQERDRLRALQLYEQAMKVAAETDQTLSGEFFSEAARTMMGYRGYYDAWRLQYLTDIDTLPDYTDPVGHRQSGARGAPVDEEGKPVFHQVPKSWKTATSDGERWRWLLAEAARVDSSHVSSSKQQLAEFMLAQFGVQTMQSYGWYFHRPARDDDETDKAAARLSLQTLGDKETIAKLATGISRFKLPADLNYITLFRELKQHHRIAQIYENRRQYKAAAKTWKLAGQQDRVDQIRKDWGVFEHTLSHAANSNPILSYRFRNAETATFTAHRIDVPKLLSDVELYIKSKPKRIDHQKINISQIGYRLIHKKETRYIKEQVAQWDVKLTPRAGHFDRRIDITVPIKKAGAYLLTSTMKNGNTCKVVVWINDTVIVQKALDKKTWFFVADAVTGDPLPDMNLRHFGYKTEWKRQTKNYLIHTKTHVAKTDDDGTSILHPDAIPGNYTCLTTATDATGRLAYLGFHGIWHGQRHDAAYKQTKVFTITDRPVYRPNQNVKFKCWIRKAQYDKGNDSQFAGKSFTIKVRNPKNDVVFTKAFKADEFGGIDGELSLPDDATLGVYNLQVENYGGNSFRVEEYKKPEFEVTIDAPTEPVMLGEKIEVKISANYLFGAPVTKGKLSYKVLRNNHDANWYPAARWDWFYGPGYWWYAYDYHWYPGWRHWGCERPYSWWWPQRRTPPEVVAQGDAKVGKDGTYTLTLDTAIAKAMHSDTDHRYSITAEVTDESRRTIVGTGKVLVARKPFKVYAWVDRGYYRVGDVIHANFSARTLDSKGVEGKGTLKLLKLSYRNGKPIETIVQQWRLDTDDEGLSKQQLKASAAGQYRLSYSVKDSKGHAIEGGYVFVVRGDGLDGKNYRFNELELIPDKQDYANGDTVRLMINTDQAKSTVVYFARPSNGVYLDPKILSLDGQSTVESLLVSRKDMPNFFVEAFTVRNGKIYSQSKEIVVPPEKRVLNLDVEPSANEYKPGEEAEVSLLLTDHAGKPFVGSTVVTVYDKAVEYISGGSNVPEIRSHFWKWRRRHTVRTTSSLQQMQPLLIPKGQRSMNVLGVFGHMVADDEFKEKGEGAWADKDQRVHRQNAPRSAMKSMAVGGAYASAASAPMDSASEMSEESSMNEREGRQDAGGPAGQSAMIAPTVRKNFADTAFWTASLTTDTNGRATINFTMPESLTGWKIRTWAMGHGTRVGEATADVVTKKNLMLRMQAPRFFVEKDEVVLSANIHNYLDSKKVVTVKLEFDGKELEPIDLPEKRVTLKPHGEMRVDWRVKVLKEGEAIIRMFALTDEESDAMEMRFPVYVHGMLKTESFSGVVRPEAKTSSLTFVVPKERRINQSRLEVRYSPTLAGAMVDALPYLVSYPYGCTEQTLNRFLPTVLTQKTLKDMGVKLADIEAKRTNLNAQEIGDDKERAKQWKRYDHNPVFSEKEVNKMVKRGIRDLKNMQLSDGGWGWFSGHGEHSYPHTTAYVVHGLQIGIANGAKIKPATIARGVEWLKRYQKTQVKRLDNFETKTKPYKQFADNLDAFIYMVLADADIRDESMNDYLYRDRTKLAVYAKSMYGLALHRQKQVQRRDMLIRNIDQFLVVDDENQTAYLNMENNHYWWYWYGSEYEAQAYYLKLLSATQPKSPKAAGLVKYLLNNRKHGTYWNSTRDTAICVEAMADYLRATGEAKPDMTVEILLDGRKVKETRITADNLFTFDNKLVLEGDAISSGKHTLEVRRKGTGPVYFNAYQSNFTLEDHITKAGLEIKVNRKYFKLTPVDLKIKTSGSRGQVLDQKVEKFKRVELKNLDTLTSGDLVEIELTIDSKNDYEYILFEDMKAAGFEPVTVRSGYTGRDSGMRAYMELRDERVCFFVQQLARGKHSIAYRMRAEIPGRFSALPTKAHAMYAPELRANSDEIKLNIID